ncbi:MAG: hypothetical protein JNJ43_08165 [Anaerolineales bacterium]|nr:hypothetical protein [Anaerolineales bacterium]
MFSIEKIPAPENTFLKNYLVDGNYVDCYTTTIDKQISFSEFVFAFYTTWLFKTEAFILTYTVRKPSSDLEAKKLANAEIDKFAAWTVEDRNENQILMCDFVGRTRSWFMVEKAGVKTKLYFGSAVVPKKRGEGLGFIFIILLGFHQIYSILLLWFAKSKLQ